MTFWSDGQVADAGSMNSITLQKKVSSAISTPGTWANVNTTGFATIGSATMDMADAKDNIIFNVVAYGALSFGGGSISASTLRATYDNMSYGDYYSQENNTGNTSNNSVVSLGKGFGGSVSAASGDKMRINIQFKSAGATGSAAVFGGACSVWYMGSVV